MKRDILLFLFIVAFVACSCAMSPKILGKWRISPNDEGNRGTMEFRTDGTFFIIDEKSNQEGSGKYLLENGDRIVLEIYGNDLMCETFQYRLKKDELSLTNTEGKTLKFKREK